MKHLSKKDINTVSGGRCYEQYEAEVPLAYLPIVSTNLKKLNQRKFDPAVLLQELGDAGLDPNQVSLKINVYCG